MEKPRIYFCIDLKSFYASVECVEWGLDPMTTNLVVADPERSNKTICLAITPAMKALGGRNRCRLFEIPENIEYITAPPRMNLYIKYSAFVYEVYLKYFAKEDIHVYSIDEAFLDVTDYLEIYGLRVKEFAIKIMEDIYLTTGITATCGIGTNLYLAKIALDITAKHVDDHIGMLDEKRYCRTLWDHRPLTDFWRIGRGTAARLERVGIITMGQIAHTDEYLLYDMFGIDAELLIDHAWGRESTTIADIKAYTPKENSISSGQVLPYGYDYDKGKLIVMEMTDLEVLSLVDKGMVTSSISLYLGYADSQSSHGTISTGTPTNSTKKIMACVLQLYDRIADRQALLRRVNLSNHLEDETFRQLDLFEDSEAQEKERRMQETLLSLRKRFGKNIVLKGMNYREGATMIERNAQIGEHKA